MHRDTTSPPAPPPSLLGRERVAVLMLLLGTVFWGSGFTWAKTSAEAANGLLGLPMTSGVGPMLLLGVRFCLAAVVWAAVVPGSLKGWSWASVRRGLLIGGTSAVGLALQNVGLAHSSEAITAFLTSLTVLFVPLLLSIGGKPPSPAVWAGVGVATGGVWLMTGAQPHGFGVGEWLGLGCAVAFSVYIIAINLIMPHEDVGRMTLAQFVIPGVMVLGLAGVLGGGMWVYEPTRLASVVLNSEVLGRLLLLTALPTLAGYALLTIFQPRIDATRASIVYLMEPVFAAAMAYWLAGRGLTPSGMAGAGLIILANLTVELLSKRPSPVDSVRDGS